MATAIYASYALLLGWAAGNSVVFGEYILHAADIEVNRWNQRGIGFACITVAFLVHATEMKWGLRLQNILGVLKLVIILIIVVGGIMTLSSRPPGRAMENFKKPWGGSRPSAYGVVTALYSVIWSYIGYSNANYVSCCPTYLHPGHGLIIISSFKSLGETRDPVRTLKIAAPLGVTLVGILYLLANISYFAAVPRDEILDSGRILAASFFRNVFGDKAERVLSIFVALSAFGNVLAVLFSQGRSMFHKSERPGSRFCFWL